MRYLLIIIIIFLTPVLTYSATLNVPKQYKTIQSAINAAKKGDTVLVYPGTYVENIDFLGKAILVKSARGPVLTIIDGSYAGSVVTFNNLCQEKSILDGFTVTKGNGSKGGGVYCWEFASPTIRNNIITANIANIGGGIYCEKFTSTVTNNIITDNVAGTGGGAYCFTLNTGSAEFSNNIIMNNSAGTTTGYGGGIYCGDGSPALINNIIANNMAAFGGGIAVIEYGVLMINNTIAENVATKQAGGILCDWCSGDITNTILWNNSAPSDPELYFWNTFPTVTYCDVKGGWPGAGNINANPLFVDSFGQDYHLTYQSPCRNAGLNAPATFPTDFEGDPRIVFGAVDMGADEFHTHLYCTGNPVPGGSVGIKFTDTPNTFPVILWLGSGVLAPPMSLPPYGYWYLKFPVLLTLNLGSIPANGVLAFYSYIPFGLPLPLELPLQAGIGKKLTNLYELKIK